MDKVGVTRDIADMAMDKGMEVMMDMETVVTIIMEEVMVDMVAMIILDMETMVNTTATTHKEIIIVKFFW